MKYDEVVKVESQVDIAKHVLEQAKKFNTNKYTIAKDYGYYTRRQKCSGGVVRDYTVCYQLK